jgi:hypothetical protein
MAATMIQLLGSGPVQNGLALTRAEYNALRRLYDFTDEPPNEKPPAPVAPRREDFTDGYAYERAMREHERAVKAHEKWEDPRGLMQAVADRNLLRYAEADGLRIMAWVARFIPEGEDPLKHVVQAFAALGCDTDPADNGWANDECDEAEEEESAAE